MAKTEAEERLIQARIQEQIAEGEKLELNRIVEKEKQNLLCRWNVKNLIRNRK